MPWALRQGPPNTHTLLPAPNPGAGKVEVPPELAQELLEASDQYMLDTLKHLCEQTITDQLAPDNVSAAFDLAENFNAPELSKQCVLYCLREQPEMVKGGSKSTPGSYAIIMQVGEVALKWVCGCRGCVWLDGARTRDWSVRGTMCRALC